MSIVRVGSTQKFSDNWDNIFTGGKAKPTEKKAAGKKKKAKPAKPEMLAPVTKKSPKKKPKKVKAKAENAAHPKAKKSRATKQKELF